MCFHLRFHAILNLERRQRLHLPRQGMICDDNISVITQVEVGINYDKYFNDKSITIIVQISYKSYNIIAR